MRLIIAGGRDFDNWYLLWSTMEKYNPDTVLCGGAKGADTLGAQWAVANMVDVSMYPADWNTHGKKAGILRNIEMANNADALVAFWDGKSKGTKHMIEEAKRKGLEVEVISY